MIWRVWLRISSILLLVILPIMVAQYFLEKESIELAFEVAEKTTPVSLYDSHLQLLKQISKYNPDGTAQYKTEFEETVASKNARLDMRIVRSKLIDDLVRQTLINTLVILSFSIAFSLLIARGIVALLEKLIRENQKHSSRLERLGSLESWQRVARMVVHELRAPITPIKLISTDIESKYNTLEPESFERYLSEGSSLIRIQVAAIERLIDSFTHFAKLPEVKKTPSSIAGLVKTFVETYENYRPGSLTLLTPPFHLKHDEIPCDVQLLNQALFNLLKNACEANPNEPISVSLTARQDGDLVTLVFSNTGKTMPPELAERIFELYVSTKTDTSTTNLGMGLTISKKIALDHGGDLHLTRNSAADGVVFELEIPHR